LLKVLLSTIKPNQTYNISGWNIAIDTTFVHVIYYVLMISVIWSFEQMWIFFFKLKKDLNKLKTYLPYFLLSIRNIILLDIRHFRYKKLFVRRWRS
jgi:uncharacterized protein involved in cysteine biosynthesis